MDTGEVEASATAACMERHRQVYERATRHPFTVSIRDGTVDPSAFKRWLVSPSSGPKFPLVTDANVQPNTAATAYSRLVRLCFMRCDASNSMNLRGLGFG